MKPVDEAEIDRRFDLHRPADANAGERCDVLRANVKLCATLVASLTPPNREQALALTKLEEALFFAIAAVVRPGS